MRRSPPLTKKQIKDAADRAQGIVTPVETVEAYNLDGPGRKRTKRAAAPSPSPAPVPPPAKPTPLSLQQERFVAEYLIDLNATQAAVRAGYSERTAKQQGSRLLTVVDIAAAIAKRQKSVLAKLELTQEMIVGELRRIGFADIRKAVRWGERSVSLVPSDEVDDDTAAAISEVSQTETGIKIKMHDKRSALVDLGKHLGLFAEKLDVNVKAAGFTVNVILAGPEPEPTTKTIDVSPRP